ncbi:hypothetical protein BACCIP111895_01906 [Neobacillus rhizosphaerae]|uniref:Aminoglycoside phosphotransferase domain-containing protein n=1 Tax=Neobacillus rhizosphaerae TaxID=2880965 RepID=A0ABM9EQ42_9BACI|nr:phosphotransferase [Neobacillus rhizosphaerae]CAH2714730.1 hypothetical protein BACCIP111895_01906 [Neobacillus rhizosphaerae]
MALPQNIVLASGMLNDGLILKRETLYKGINGRWVERFYLSPSESYIFKPLTNDGQLGKEVWVHEHILSLFPAIFPKIISYMISEDPELNWMILEDLGQLSHDFNEKSVFGVIKWTAWWHSLPVEKFRDVPLAGLKPRVEEIAADICLKKDEFLRLLPVLQIEERHIQHIYSLLDRFVFSKKLVLSHGDLHLGNYAIVNNKLMILDWEHSHLNTPYWDLYHIIDMSHPLFPKEITSKFRESVLRYYLDHVNLEIDEAVFMKEYHLFSAVFSIWMILLIQKDLQANDGKWPVDQLNAQLKETVASLKQCAAALYI